MKAHPPHPHLRLLRLRRWVSHAFNLALLGLLVLQGLLLGTQLMDKEVPLPGFVLRRAEAVLARELGGLRVSSGGAELGLNGKVFLRGVRVHALGDDPVVEADAVLADFNAMYLLVGRMELERIRIVGGGAWCPAALSPDGMRREVMGSLTLDLVRSGGWWRIERFAARAGNLHLTAHGTLAPPAVGGKPDPDRAGTVLRNLRLMARRLPVLECLESPTLNVEVQGTKDAANRMAVALRARGLRLKEPVGVLAGDIEATTRVAWDEELKFEEPLLLRVVRPRVPEAEFEARLLQAEAMLDSVTPLRGRARVWLEKPATRGVRLDAAAGTVALPWEPTLRAAFLALRGADEVRVQAEADLAEQAGEVRVRGRVAPGTLLPYLPPEVAVEVKAVKLERPPVFETRIQLGKKAAFERVDWRVELGATAYQSVEFGAADVRGYATPARVEVSRALLYHRDWEMEGFYEQDLKTDEYRFLLSGTADPHSFDAVMSDWWTQRLWPRFGLKREALPQADVDVRGRWGAPYDTYVFGSVDLRDFTCTGVPVDRAHVGLHVRPDLIAAYGITIERPDGRADGTMQWTLNPPDDHTVVQYFNIRSSLPFGVAARMARELEDVDSWFQTEVKPDLKVRGMLYGSGSPRNGQRDIDAEATVPGPFRFYGMPGDNLEVKGRITEAGAYLPDMVFGIAGGRGTATAHIRNVGEERDLDCNVRIENADKDRFFYGLRLIGAKEAQPPPFQMEPDDKPGVLDGEAVITGRLGKFETFKGSGKTVVRDPDLGRVQLLGALSRALSHTPVKLGSSLLNKAESSLHLMDKRVFFPDMQITGPTARLDLWGNVSVENGALDFLVIFYPLSNVQTPVLGRMLDVLDPFTRVFRIKVSGTIDKPEFDVAFRPLGIFNSKPSETPGTPPLDKPAPSTGDPRASSEGPTPGGGPENRQNDGY